MQSIRGQGIHSETVSIHAAPTWGLIREDKGVRKNKSRRQVQDQLNRILTLSQDTGNYRRLRRAVDTIEEQRGYKVYNGENLSVLTQRQSDRVQGMNTTYGRRQAIRRAANGQSAG